MKDPYGLLGVSRGASEEDVRKAYRRLAREYHPDANPGDIKAEERFKEIQQAHEILSNPKKRRDYDERSRPTSRKRRPGSSRKATRGSRKTTGSASGGRDGGREINWQLKVEGVEDIARISRILGMDITRLSKLAGDGIKRKTSFDKSGSADASGEKPSKPPKPPKPPKTRKRPDA